MSNQRRTARAGKFGQPRRPSGRTTAGPGRASGRGQAGEPGPATDPATAAAQVEGGPGLDDALEAAGGPGMEGASQPVTSAPAGVWAGRWERWSARSYVVSGIILCATSLVGRSVPSSGGATAVVRTVVGLAIGLCGAALIVVPWVGKLSTRPRVEPDEGGTATATLSRAPGSGRALTERPTVEQRLRTSSYPKALWAYSALLAVLAVLAVLVFLALAIGRHAPGFILGVVLFGVPATLFGSLSWTTKDLWSRA